MIITAKYNGVITFGADTLNLIDIETGDALQTLNKHEVQALVNEGELVTIGKDLAISND